MKQIRLESNNEKIIRLSPEGGEIRLTSILPYLIMDSISVPDRQQNSHLKTLSGTYVGPTPTSIRIRNHYPHSISGDWLRWNGWWDLGHLMYASGYPACFINENFAMGSEISYGNAFKYNTVEDNVWSVSNGAWDKEECFWGEEDWIRTSGGYRYNNPTRYSNPLVYRDVSPMINEEDYYYDTDETEGYPYGSPAGWVTASVDSNNKTWSCDVTMSQWWHNVDSLSGQAMYLTKKNDDRLQFLEVQMNFEVGDEIETATRVYYVWHCPQNWGNSGTLGLKYISGIQDEPSGARACSLGLGLTGCSYDFGWNVAGGEFDITVGNVPLDFSAVELNSLTSHKKIAEDPTFRQINPPYVSLKWTVENPSQIIRAYASYQKNPYYPTFSHELDVSRMSIIDGFIHSLEFQEDFSEFSTVEDDEEYDVTFVIDFSTKIIGNTSDFYAQVGGGDTNRYGWMNRTPLCSQICKGTYTGAGGLSFFQDDGTYLIPSSAWISEGETAYSELLGAGEDKEPALLSSGPAGASISIFGNANDGGRTRLYFGQALQSSAGSDRGVVVTPSEFGSSAIEDTVVAISETGWRGNLYSPSFVVKNAVELMIQAWSYNAITHEYEKTGTPYAGGWGPVRSGYTVGRESLS